MAPVQTPHALSTEAGRRQLEREPLLPVLRARRPDHQRQPPRADPPTSQAKFRVTTLRPHGWIPPFTDVKIRGVRTVAGANSCRRQRCLDRKPVLTGRGRSTQSGSNLGPTAKTRPAGDDCFAPGRRMPRSAAPRATASQSPTGQQDNGKLAGFKLKLPPGFLGQPDRARGLPDVPVHRQRRAPDRSILGHSVTETVIDGASNFTPPTRIPTRSTTCQTLGLEPARLGTTASRRNRRARSRSRSTCARPATTGSTRR